MRKNRAMIETYLQKYFRIPSEEIAQVASLFREEKLQKGDFFVKKGRQCRKLGFLLEGYLRFYFTTETKEITHWIFWQGHLVTDVSSFYLQTPSKWHVQALTDCHLYTINYDDYQKINQFVPSWGQINQTFIVKCFSGLENRIFTFLSMSAEERYQYLFDAHKELFQYIPLNYLASMLGITPETLSRIRKKRIS
ncbi:hypothetical protein BKI52_08220 [marine bacterium AO1-C]|nr:hypothetical protein BKI52_08220 [marine bacterium AO1-C]